MTTEQIIATLREHNEWRRGGEGEMLDPKTIGEAIEAACDALEELENHKASSIHTCHDNCKRPMCVLRRERDDLLDRLTGLELRMPEELARLEHERDAERALADRLAGALKNPSVLVAVEALIAWKEARCE